VHLVTPPENDPYRPEVRIGTRPPWPDSWRHANGLRFTAVPLPQGVAIASARLSFKYKYHTGMPINVHLWGEAVDSSQPFTNADTPAHLRPRTTASVAWSMNFVPAAGMWFDGPDIASLVQEIINRPGWSVYNALSILIESDIDTQHYIDVWAHDHSPQMSPRIEICYYAEGVPISTATPTPVPTPTATKGPNTPTPTPTRVNTPTRQPSPGTKQGLTWTHADTIPARKIAAAGARAVHHWGYNASKALAAINAGLVYYPVQWDCSRGANSVNEGAIRAFINAAPHKLKGLTWLAFNEPELEHQAGCTPLQAARAFHKLDQILRRGSNPADPTAKLYCCGTIAPYTDFLRQFANEYHDQYGEYPPVDGVHIHLYRGESRRLNWCRLRDHLDAFRSWQSGQAWLADKPIVVSEWGVLSNSRDHPDDPQYLTGDCTPGCTCDIMAQMWNVFEERSYVEHHLWWTAYVDPSSGDPNQYWDNGNIFANRYGTRLTDPVGLKYKSLSTND